MSTPEPDVDALREKLRSLGYLDAGVDRFVLAPARAGRSVWAIASRSSLRIAILAGLLLGLSGALAAGVRVPGLVTGLRDTFVLATMLAVVLGAAVGTVALAVILVAARAVRWFGPRTSLAARVRPLSLAAGASVGAVCLAYLTLWWRAMDAVPDGRSWWMTLLALVVAAGVSLLLGHATTTTTQAVITNEIPEAGATPRTPLSMRGSVAMVAVAAAAAVAALALAPTNAADDAPAPTLTVVPTGARVLVFAVDGYDAALGAKYVPSHGARQAFVPVSSMPRQSDDPAREWTTIATGQPVERHGVTALEVRRVAGLEGQLPSANGNSRWTATLGAATDLLRLTQPAINTGAIRREKTFWEVAAEAGLRTVAVNWWTSWPARDTDGVVLTERAVLRLEAGGPLAGELAPASRFEDLQKQWPGLASSAVQLAERVLAGLPRTTASDHAVGEASSASLSPAVAAAVREAALVDAQQLVLFRALLSDQVDLGTVYLPGLDILGMKLRGLAGQQSSTAVLVESAEAVRRYYEWLFDQIADSAGPGASPARKAAPADGALVLVVGHPGRSGAQTPAVLSVWWRSTWPVSPGTRDQAEPRDSRKAGDPLNATVGRGAQMAGSLLDVAPTVLQSLGVPLSRELPGRAAWRVTPSRLALPDEGGAEADVPGPTPVSTYGRRGRGPARATGPDALEEEMRDRLRSLGYVK